MSAQFRLSLRFCAVLVCFVGTSASPGELDERALRGRNLHDSVCHGCHGEEMYAQPSRNPYLDLRRQTELWLSVMNVKWSAEQVGDVVHYLRSTFYKP
jgi:mono/diheme cytochrome c family protein